MVMFSGALLILSMIVPAWAAHRMSAALTPGRDGVLRALESLIGALALIQFAVLTLGLTGTLNRTGFLVALGTLAALGWIASRGSSESTLATPLSPREEGPGVRGPSSQSRESGAVARREPLAIVLNLQWFLAVVLCAVTGYGLYRITLTGPTQITGDDSNYHLSLCLIWLREGRFSLPPIDVASSFPFAAELLPVWMMLPFPPDAIPDMLTWTSASALPWIAMFVLAIAVLARSLGGERASWAVAVLVVVSTPMMIGNAGSFASVDNALPALLIAALALMTTLQTDAGRDPRLWYGRCVFIAAAVGLAAGTKFTGIPLSVFLAAALAWQAWRLAGLRRVLGTVALATPIVALAGGYWYLRNALHFGNPFYPARCLGMPHDASIYVRNTLAEYVAINGWSKSIGDIYEIFFNWPPSLAWIAVVGIVVGPPLAVAVDAVHRRRLAMLAAVSWAMAATTLVLLPGMPWSATEMDRIQATTHRYIMIVPVLGWIWLGIALSRPAIPAIVRVLALTVPMIAVALVQRASLGSWPAVVLAMAIVVWTASRVPLRVRLRPALVALAAASLLFAVWAIRHPSKRQATVTTLAAPYGRDISDTVRLLETLPPGRLLVWEGRHVLLSQQRHEPIMVAYASPRPLHVGDRVPASGMNTIVPQPPLDLGVHLAEADIVLCLDFRGLSDHPLTQLYEAVKDDPAFELRQQTRYAAVFVRAARSLQPVSRTRSND